MQCNVYRQDVTPSAEQTTEPWSVTIAKSIKMDLTKLSVILPPIPCATPIMISDNPKNPIAKLKLMIFGAVFGCFALLISACCKKISFAFVILSFYYSFVLLSSARVHLPARRGLPHVRTQFVDGIEDVVRLQSARFVIAKGRLSA